MIRCKKGTLVTDAPAENVINFLVRNRDRLDMQCARLKLAYENHGLRSDYHEWVRKRGHIETINKQLAKHDNLHHIVIKGYSLN
jgi:hypothetical protein